MSPTLPRVSRKKRGGGVACGGGREPVLAALLSCRAGFPVRTGPYPPTPTPPRKLVRPCHVALCFPARRKVLTRSSYLAARRSLWGYATILLPDPPQVVAGAVLQLGERERARPRCTAHHARHGGYRHVRLACHITCRGPQRQTLHSAGEALYDLVGGVDHVLVVRPRRVQRAG